MGLQVLQRLSGGALRSLLPKQAKPNSFNNLCPIAANIFINHEVTNNKSHVRQFQTSSIHLDKEKPNVQTKIMTLTNPFKYISLKIKMILMRGYFDEKFTEKEFLAGARHAIVYVSSKLAKGEIKEMAEVLTQEGMKSVQNLFYENRSNSNDLLVNDKEIMTLTLNDLGFEYGESGRKWAYALVVCYCSGKDSFSKQASDFDFEILVSQPRLIKYSFCREYTPGSDDAGWLVDQVDYLNWSKPSEED